MAGLILASFALRAQANGQGAKLSR